MAPSLLQTRGGGTAPENQVSVDFSMSIGFDKVSRTPDLQSTYARGSVSAGCWVMRLTGLNKKPNRLPGADGVTFPFQGITGLGLANQNYWLHEDLITEPNVYDTSFIYTTRIHFGLYHFLMKPGAVVDTRRSKDLLGSVLEEYG